MSFARRMNGVADKLLTKFDERAGDSRLTLLVQGDKVWVDGAWQYPPPTTYYMTGIQRTVSQALVNGTTIQSGDKIVTVKTPITDENGGLADVIPTTKDKVRIDGNEWSIVDVPNSNYTGEPLAIVYKLQVRK